jgi:hypothetical protein
MTASPSHKAVLGLVVTAAYADGQTELADTWLDNHVRRHRLFGDLGAEAFLEARQVAASDWAQSPRDTLWQTWARDLPKSWVMPTFELAAEAVLLDGRVADIERKGLIRMAAVLGIAPADFNAVVARVSGKR